MLKIAMLTPCLMLDTNKEFNHKCIQFNYEHLKPDAYAIYDQCFSEEDKDPRFTYVGNADRRMGWVPSRNGLLKWFYESDYDFAFWIDANSTVSKSTLNDISTIFEHLRAGKLNDVDTCFATLGMWINGDRRIAKKAADFKENVHLVPARFTKDYNWMHGLIIKNFKKYYNQEFYIDERCDVMQGTAEDVYFARLMRKFTKSYLAPTVVCNKPDSSKSCTMANGKGTYEYPPVKYEVVDGYIREQAEKYKYHHVDPLGIPKEIVIPRNDYLRDKMAKPFKYRKIVEDPNAPKRIALF